MNLNSSTAINFYQTLFPRWSGLSTFLLSLIICFGALLYLPGISGPYMFDDTTNLLENTYVKIQSLDSDSLYHASFSLHAGLLQRPISMLSFALNYYFAGSFADPMPFKLTNLVIHTVNGLLVFWLMQLVFARLALLANPKQGTIRAEANHAVWLAFAVALFWMIHPIQVSSVLYVVQRMTELSALFMLAGLIAYLKGRASLKAGRTAWGAAFFVASLALFLPLGLFSKENAILLPVFMLVLEFVLFSGETPWNRWHTLTRLQRWIILVSLVLLTVIGMVAVIRYALPMYAARRFDLIERVLTEGRVVFVYLSLILLPRIDRFGNQHDDIPISISLFEPWTTLPALLGHAGLLVTAFLVRKRLPFLSLGILWFYTGHLLESTVIALEIAHEHRNYLPVLGAMLIIVGGIQHAAIQLQKPKLIWLLPAAAVVFAAVTLQRASQWGDEHEFYRYEALHHPESARSQTGYARSLAAQGLNEQAINALRRASEIDPSETGTLIQIVKLEARQGRLPSQADQEMILSRLRSPAPLSDIVFLEIRNIAGCLAASCRTLQTPMEQWLRAILERKTLTGDVSFYRYALGLTLASQGRINEALREFHRSHALDPRFLHPLFAIAKIHVQLGAINKAEDVLAKLHEANKNTPHPRTREIAAVEADIEKLKRQRK